MISEAHWGELSLNEQLGNIGSEVGRALSWQKRGGHDHVEHAVGRALELFDLTLDDRRWIPRLRELARAREVLADYFYGGNNYGSTAVTLERYFYYFAYAARTMRE